MLTFGDGEWWWQPGNIRTPNPEYEQISSYAHFWGWRMVVAARKHQNSQNEQLFISEFWRSFATFPYWKWTFVVFWLFSGHLHHSSNPETNICAHFRVLTALHLPYIKNDQKTCRSPGTSFLVIFCDIYTSCNINFEGREPKSFLNHNLVNS